MLLEREASTARANLSDDEESTAADVDLTSRRCNQWVNEADSLTESSSAYALLKSLKDKAMAEVSAEFPPEEPELDESTSSASETENEPRPSEPKKRRIQSVSNLEVKRRKPPRRYRKILAAPGQFPSPQVPLRCYVRNQIAAQQTTSSATANTQQSVQPPRVLVVRRAPQSEPQQAPPGSVVDLTDDVTASAQDQSQDNSGCTVDLADNTPLAAHVTSQPSRDKVICLVPCKVNEKQTAMLPFLFDKQKNTLHLVANAKTSVPGVDGATPQTTLAEQPAQQSSVLKPISIVPAPILQKQLTGNHLSKQQTPDVSKPGDKMALTLKSHVGGRPRVVVVPIPTAGATTPRQTMFTAANIQALLNRQRLARQNQIQSKYRLFGTTTALAKRQVPTKPKGPPKPAKVVHPFYDSLPASVRRGTSIPDEIVRFDIDNDNEKFIKMTDAALFACSVCHSARCISSEHAKTEHSLKEVRPPEACDTTSDDTRQREARRGDDETAKACDAIVDHESNNAQTIEIIPIADESGAGEPDADVSANRSDQPVTSKDTPSKDAALAMDLGDSVADAIHTKTVADFEETPYVCTLCRIGFSSAFLLRFHCEKHYTNKPYMCADCNVRCDSDIHLWRHRDEEHGVGRYDSRFFLW